MGKLEEEHPDFNFACPFSLSQCLSSPSFTSSSPLSILDSEAVKEAVTQYLLVEDGLRRVFRENFLLDLEVRPWCGDILVEHDDNPDWLQPGIQIQLQA